MTQVHLFAWLARILTVLVCWAILMGVPALLFAPPMDDTKYKIFLGVFYSILLFLGTVVGRSWGGWGVIAVAAPFMLLFVTVIVQHLVNPDLTSLEKGMATLNFGAIFLVSWLAWRLGRRLKSPAREKGKLI
jgi:hypothetical protein